MRSNNSFKRQKPVYKNAVAGPRIEIAPLGKITTRAFKLCKIYKHFNYDKDNLASQAKKIRGDQTKSSKP